MGNTKDEIMARMLALIPPEIDKSEGSFIWDALAPMAIEMAQAYEEIALAKEQSFVGTATDTYLDRGTSERGVNRLPASYAVGVVTLTGTPGTVLASGTVLATLNGTLFETTAEATIGAEGTTSVPIKAIVAGASGLVSAGTITVIPVSVAGLTAVNNSASTYGGENEETDDELRARYFAEISQRAQDGNVAQYVKWAEEFSGIGRVRIFQLWNGANTVKVSILDANNTVAGQGLVDSFQEYLDPGAKGLGNGVAPIGAIVSVTTATAVSLNVAVTVVLTKGYTEPTGVQDAIETYFADIAYNKNTVSYLGLAAQVLSVASVDQLKSITINSGTADISLGTEEIPVLGTFSSQVVTE